MDHLNAKELNFLYDVILSLKDREECKRLLNDLCTVRELSSMAQRLSVARLLKAGKTFTEIEEETGASSATIARINRCLHYGSAGYLMVLDKLTDNESRMIKG